MTTRTATPATFVKMLANVRSGDTLVLAPGNYGALTLSHKHFADDVTIKGGTFTSVTFAKVSGVTLDGTTVIFTPTANSTSNSQAIRIWGSDDISILNAKVTGGESVNGVVKSATKLDASGNVLGLPVGKGINIDSSSDIVISDSVISKFAKGITFSDVTNLTISDNQIHSLRTTPISGSGHDGLTITGNHTWNSSPWNYGGTGDHGDRIHLWTDDRPWTNVVISGNLLTQGAGAPMMGIYLDDNLKGFGFPDVLISGNTVIDGNGQGMRLENVSGMVVDNELIWSGTGRAHNDTPRFQIADNVHDVTFLNNIGNVAIQKTAHDLDFINQIGTFTKGAGLSLAAQQSIHIGKVPQSAFADTGDHNFAGFDLTGQAITMTVTNLHAFA